MSPPPSAPTAPALPAAPCVTAPPDADNWFKEEVHTFDQQLKSYLRRTFPAVRDVDDIVQESYLRIWQAGLTRRIHFTKAFLFQIVRRLAIDDVRRRQVRSEDQAVDLSATAIIADELPNPAASFSRQEKFDLVCNALASLPDRTREVVFLRKFQNLPQKQVAAQLGIAERTVENRLAQGMQLCEKYLLKHGVEGFLPDER